MARHRWGAGCQTWERPRPRPQHPLPRRPRWRPPCPMTLPSIPRSGWLICPAWTSSTVFRRAQCRAWLRRKAAGSRDKNASITTLLMRKAGANRRLPASLASWTRRRQDRAITLPPYPVPPINNRRNARPILRRSTWRIAPRPQEATWARAWQVMAPERPLMRRGYNKTAGPARQPRLPRWRRSPLPRPPRPLHPQPPRLNQICRASISKIAAIPLGVMAKTPRPRPNHLRGLFTITPPRIH